MKPEHRNTPNFACDQMTTRLYYADSSLQFSYEFGGAQHFVKVNEEGYYNKDGEKQNPVKVEAIDCIYPMLLGDAKRHESFMLKMGTPVKINHN